MYQIPLSALHPEAQLRYFKEHGQPFPLVSEKSASAKAYKPLDHFSAAEREEIRQEMETLARWQEYRRQPGRTAELDAEFVELLRQEDPGRAVSVKTLYRKKKALEENDLAGLVDGRGKARKGRSSIDETVWQAFLSFYLDLREPKAKECYEATIQYVRRHYPALVDGIPTYSTFVRHIEKDVPYAVQQLGREGKKALRDRCAPYVRRIYDNMESNEIWVADNHTFDIISRDGKTTHRLYLTAFLDARSGIFTGVYVTTAPSSQSTVIALRRGIQRYGIRYDLLVATRGSYLFLFPSRGGEGMEGMLFDAGTWWLVTIIVTVVVGLIGYLFGRSVFKALDENRADIKEVRESYTTQKDHKDDLDDIRREIKEVRSEMKTEIQALSEDIKEVKEKCLRKSDFERSVLQLESKVDALTRYLMERRV